jgi:hypothetical protein
MGEHVWESFGRSQMRRVHRRAEQPQGWLGGGGGGRFEPVVPGAERDHHAACTHQRRHVVEVFGEVLNVAIITAAAQSI